ncbi:MULTISPECIES: hypothetical protein [unclassified Streptomyces]|uniref:hypothetical protein n=1 Tax=Streptomyces TaxID=1883 RepID=UPI0001C1B066|nr:MULTISPECIES: hypothetical protein [unclassified Streptomyces]AEN11916.1 conserved hypothetical protein [Streptomyces sp. SirexAA-E]MYR66397.1 hypothetical protein [Streptomyces sp. SID4939]MYS03439.1 hypothetical protein [Streptomyces sp. SID4940]MYT65195.1 hypothetical protein [Streptomyces sp. SID8357]MYT84929.1 hypothetical protein [Streptomyces sp. SID8360]
MPDRLRTAHGHPLPERASTLMRERQSSPQDPSTPSGPSSASGSSSSGTGSGSAPAPSDDNPFAAPPEGRPDQPWQPRHPSHGGEDGNDRDGTGSSDDRPAWGSQWSDRQPGRQDGGFGSRSGGPGGPRGQGGPEGNPGGLRWDPTDPAQRRARYAVLGGMWAFFFALFDFPEIALLLGALAAYWAISALRTGPRKAPPSGAVTTGTPDGGPDRATVPAQPDAAQAAPSNGGRQLTTAAVSGLVTALLALSIVATTYTVQLVYRDYYTCVNDALTKTGALACNEKLPDPLEPFFGVKE